MPALTWMSMLRLALCATLLGLASGCNRAQYREQADREATQLVAEKSYDPRWSLGPCFDIEIDPRSRFYNAYDRTHPPMPPDDPDSHRYMHCIDGKRGWKYWHEHGDICDLESPWWREALGDYTQQTEDGKLLLRLEDSVRLARIHSPAYQTQLETIYLSALDVSSERFRFDTQFFGGSGATYRHLGALRPLGESNTLTIDNDLLLERRFATAADLLVTFANSAVWEFNGDDSNFTTSVLGFAFVQPLLRRGGRVIALEQLTIAERTLLANLRAFQRYRHGFYTNVAIGQLGVTGPQRRGGFFGGTGLTGFTGQGSGGFGGVGDVTGFGRVGFGVGGAAGAAGAGFAGGGAGTVGGFIGLLQQLQQIRNTRNSLNLQLRTLALLEANLDAGLIDIAQVDQFRQNIQTERANLLQAENNLENSLDTFKRTTLGLPPGLRLAPDDGMIRQFQLIDPATSDVQDALAGYLSEFGDLPEQPPDEALTSAFNRIGELVTLVSELFPIVADDLKQMEGVSEERMQGMSEPEQELIESIHANLSETFDEVQQRQDKTAETLENLRAGLNPQTLEATADGVVELLTDLETIVGELSLVQARSRLEMISVDPVYLTPEHALEIARCSRLDWANNRAALVDTWRLIEFNANALQSNLTVRLDGDVRTVGDNPTDFRGKNGLFRASVRFDPPLTRLLERNSFRQQLIQYEQDRRQLIQFEDGIHQTLRQTLRGLNQLRTNLEYQRQAVAIAIRRVDETREVLSAPVPPAPPGQLPPAFGPTAAQNLLFALSDLRNTQNNLMSVWLNYHASRTMLYREMGIMQLDESGVWIDEPLSSFVLPLDGETDTATPPPVPREWYNEPGRPGASGGPTANPGSSDDSASSNPNPDLVKHSRRTRTFSGRRLRPGHRRTPRSSKRRASTAEPSVSHALSNRFMVFATHMADQTRGLVRFVGDGISVFRAKRVKDADETVTDSAGDETPATEADRQRLMRLIDNGGNRRTVEQVRFDIDASEASPDRTTGADRPSDPPE